MDLPVLLAAMATAVGLALASLLWTLARAGDDVALRLYVVVALSSALFCAAYICYGPGMPPWAAALGGHSTAVFGASSTISWLGYVRVRAGLPAWGGADRVPMLLAAGAGLLLGIPGLFIHTPPWIMHLDWFHAHYAVPVTSWPAIPLFVVTMLPTMATLRHLRPGRQGSRVAHLLTSMIFLVGGANDFAVGVLRLYQAPLVLPMSLGAILAGLAVDLAAQVNAQRAALRQLTERLRGAVEERTEDLRTTRVALHDSEQLAALGRLAAGVGHEINNPLTYVAGNLAMVRAAVADGDPEVVQLIDDAIDGADRIASIVRDLRVLVRKEHVEDAEASLDRVLTAVVELTGCRKDPMLELVIDVPAGLHVRGSAHRLGQVFTNLVVNAHQAMAAQPQRRLELRGRATADEVWVDVSDHGQGIAPENLGRVFEPFFTTRGHDGQGLGLAVVDALVRNAGGTTAVRSVVGKGTTFTVRLQRATPPAPAAVVVAPPAALAPAAGRSRVLVVDDDPLVLRMLTRALAAFEVVSTTEPARALTLLEQPHSFVVVVCDVSMPGLSGPELCARIEVTRPGTANRFLFVTGGAMSPTERDFLNLPHVRWLEKPVRPAELRRAVESMAQAPS